MKRLFILVDSNGHRVNRRRYYESKMRAKQARNHHNSTRPALPPVHVSVGPDHWRYKGSK